MDNKIIIGTAAVLIVIILIVLFFVFGGIFSVPCVELGEKIADPSLKCCHEGASPTAQFHCLNDDCTEFDEGDYCQLPIEN